MNIIGTFFTTLFINPTLNVLSLLFHLLTYLHIPSALGFSIILLTILIRFILYPLTASQLKTSKKMQELAPKLNKLKEQHAKDAQRLQKETMALYKQHGVNPAAGCVPLLIQLPLIWGLYSVLQHAVSSNGKQVVDFVNHAAYVPWLKLHEAWNPYFFGIPLHESPSKLLGAMPFVLLVPILTAAFQFAQSKMMLPAIKAEEKIDKAAQKMLKSGKEEKKADDFQTAFQTQSLYIFPIMIGFFSWTLPVGLSFYWNTFTIFGIIQQYQIQGWGGLEPFVKKYIKKLYGR